eukprot:4406443-Amphidinium_carterae.1
MEGINPAELKELPTNSYHRKLTVSYSGQGSKTSVGNAQNTNPKSTKPTKHTKVKKPGQHRPTQGQRPSR